MRQPSTRFLRRAAGAVIAAFLLATTSCGGGNEEPRSVAAPISGTLRIGLIPEHNLFAQKKRYQPIADFLTKELRTQVELKILSRYGNIIDNFVSAELDGAFFGSFTGALAQKRLDVEPLARPEYADGTSTYHGLLFVRRDSGIEGAQDMKGKRFAFVDKATTAGWLLPMHFFQVNGVTDPLSWLAESYFAGSHEGAIFDVLEKKADIGAAKNAVFNRLAVDHPRIPQELRILARSPEVPENTLAVRRNLDADFKHTLTATLLSMNESDEGRQVLSEFGAVRFIRTTPEDYRAVFLFADEIGLDLESYDYFNE